MLITQCPSPNFGPRKLGITRPDIVVIHYTAMQNADAALEILCDPKKEVSAHYLISRDGGVTQMVDEEMRAWHAGAGRWGRWEIPLHHIIAHSDLAPIRKSDPGVRFDWKRLAINDLSIWPSDVGREQALDVSLTDLGYDVSGFGLEACLQAFRARFAPTRTGAETIDDRRDANALAQHFCIDPNWPSS